MLSQVHKASWDLLNDKWYQWLTDAEMAVCDHTYMDDGSYAGPDSGREFLLCTKCGHTVDNIYY